MKKQTLEAAKKVYRTITYPAISQYNVVYEKKLRERLAVHNFSIICSNCAGGVIYHRLGEPFNSPTVNLWIENKDFVRFCANLQEYLGQRLEFIGTDYGYPVGVIDGILIHFNHVHEEAEARELWERRKTRVDYNNLYLLMVGDQGLTEEDIRLFGKIFSRNKAILSERMIQGCSFCYQLKRNKYRKNSSRFMDKGLDLRYSFERQFDFVEWLNEGEKKSG